MKKYILLIISSYLAVALSGQLSNTRAIDSIFIDWDKPDVPGCALGIIKDGQLVYARGFGMANLEYDIPNDENSVFRIGSTSKQFTAACIVLLAEQGQLNLDDNLRSLFPEIPTMPDYSDKITIRHLLNHTSGIRDYLHIGYLKGFRNDDYYEDAEIMQWLLNQEDLNFEPGEEYLYSNSGYWLLGQIVNKFSGRNMADFAKAEIFEPLGMTDTHFHNDHKQIVKNRASGYMPVGDNGFRISMTTLNMIGDGGIFTSINDIKKWDDAFYNSSVLSKEFWQMMTQQGELNDGEVLDYASGLVISDYKGLKTVRHGGAFVGFRAELLRFPEQRVSIAIFTNRGDANPSRMADQVADIILKEWFGNTSSETGNEKEEAKRPFIKLTSAALEKFSGEYWNSEGSYSRKIYVKNDTLRYYRGENSISDLIPISNYEFRMINVPSDVTVSFPDAGMQKMSVIVDGGDPIHSKKYTPKKYNKQELANFEGSYYSKELDVNYNLMMEEDALILYINESKKSPLASIMTDLFSNDDVGIFQFYKNENETIGGFRLASGRVKNLKFEKMEANQY